MTADEVIHNPTGSGSKRERAKTHRVATRRRQIIDAATHLWQINGFHDTSVQAVADEAGISVGLIYTYVKNKEDLLLLVITDILEEYATELPAAISRHDEVIGQLTEGFYVYCEIVDRRRQAVVLAYRETKTLASAGQGIIMAMEVETTNLFAELLRRGMTKGIFQEADEYLVAYDLILIAHAWALKHWFFGPRMSLEMYTAKQFSLLLRAILATPEAITMSPAAAGRRLDQGRIRPVGDGAQ
jgi:AcrR family transcriptional regulator